MLKERERENVKKRFSVCVLADVCVVSGEREMMEILVNFVFNKHISLSHTLSHCTKQIREDESDICGLQNVRKT